MKIRRFENCVDFDIIPNDRIQHRNSFLFKPKENTLFKPALFNRVIFR